MSTFCILGYIFNDVTLKSAATSVIKMRLGGREYENTSRENH